MTVVMASLMRMGDK